MRKRIEYDLLDIALAILLFCAIGLCMHSMYKCDEAQDRARDIRENQVVTIKYNNYEG